MGTQWQSIFYVILTDASGKLIQMQPTDSGWTLPYIVSDRRIQLHTMEPLNYLVRRVLGVNATILCCVDATVDRAERCVEAIYLLENHSPDTDELAAWVDCEILDELALAVPRHRVIIESALDSIEIVAPWQQRGWFDRASSWIRAKMLASDRPLTAPIEQVRSWDLSCVLRVPSDGDSCYFKATGSWPLVANEAHAMEVISRWFPDHIPEPLAIDETRGWILLSDFGQPLRGMPYRSALSLWENALRDYAHMQFETVDRDVLSAGCIDRRLDVLLRQIDPLMADEDALTGLTRDQIAHVRANVPHLKALCAELWAHEIPLTLVHGDFHSGNIALRDGHTLFFDWTDACAAHPFFDLVTFLDDAQHQLSSSDLVHLRDAYLGTWTPFEPMHRLLSAWAVARRLGALHQAISYHSIFSSIGPEAKQEMDGAIAYWLLQTL